MEMPREHELCGCHRYRSPNWQLAGVQPLPRRMPGPVQSLSDPPGPESLWLPKVTKPALDEEGHLQPPGCLGPKRSPLGIPLHPPQTAPLAIHFPSSLLQCRLPAGLFQTSLKHNLN